MATKRSAVSKPRPRPTARYPELDYPRPAVTVDIVVFTILDADLKVLLIERGHAPFAGAWALPGGFVRIGGARGSHDDSHDPHDDDSRGDSAGARGEDLEAAARRELGEETGLPDGSVYLEQLYTFGAADRDPRARIITVAYYALVRPDLAPFVAAGTDASAARWWSVAHEVDPATLAFDHARILEVALERVRGKIDYTDIAFELVPSTFSTAELRAVHEVVKGRAYDPANFRRRLRRMITDGVIEEAPGRRITGRRPAKVYRFSNASEG